MNAQFLPMLEENKHWIFLTHQENDAGVHILSGFIVNIQGDTIINNKNYYKIYSHKLIGEHNCQFPPCFTPSYPYEIEEGTLYALLREDTDNGIIYSYSLDSTFCEATEFELFNFSLTHGDSLHHCVRKRLWQGQDQMQNIGVVDSISYDNSFGKQRKVIHTYGDGVFEGLQYLSALQITEGIGFNLYGFFPGSQDELIDVCFGTLTECNIIASVKNHTEYNNLKIFPNPAINELNIESNYNISRIIMTNELGQMVFKGKESTIDLSFLKAGVYFVEVLMENNKTIKSKFVKLN